MRDLIFVKIMIPTKMQNINHLKRSPKNILGRCKIIFYTSVKFFFGIFFSITIRGKKINIPCEPETSESDSASDNKSIGTRKIFTRYIQVFAYFYGRG